MRADAHTDVEQNTQTVKIILLPVCIQTTTVDTDASKKGTRQEQK